MRLHKLKQEHTSAVKANEWVKKLTPDPINPYSYGMLWPWLLVLSDCFYGIIYSINGVSSVRVLKTDKGPKLYKYSKSHCLLFLNPELVWGSNKPAKSQLWLWFFFWETTRDIGGVPGIQKVQGLTSNNAALEAGREGRIVIIGNYPG